MRIQVRGCLYECAKRNARKRVVVFVTDKGPLGLADVEVAVRNGHVLLHDTWSVGPNLTPQEDPARYALWAHRTGDEVLGDDPKHLVLIAASMLLRRW